MPKKLTTKEFIQKAKIIHNDKFDYSKVEYNGSKSKINIICPIHGSFYRTPDNHLYSSGCSKCGYHKTKNKIKYDKNKFIIKSSEVHGDKFDYSKVEYKHSRFKVNIICPIHGLFKQEPSSHIRGCGCPKCANENYVGKYQLYKALNNYYNFSGYLYIIKMYDDQESFTKIGISKNLKQRFNQLKKDSSYNIEIIKTQFFKDFNQAIIKEHELHEKYKEYSYLPKNKFGGRYECFKESIMN